MIFSKFPWFFRFLLFFRECVSAWCFLKIPFISKCHERNVGTKKCLVIATTVNYIARHYRENIMLISWKSQENRLIIRSKWQHGSNCFSETSKNSSDVFSLWKLQLFRGKELFHICHVLKWLVRCSNFFSGNHLPWCFTVVHCCSPRIRFFPQWKLLVGISRLLRLSSFYAMTCDRNAVCRARKRLSFALKLFQEESSPWIWVTSCKLPCCVIFAMLLKFFFRHPGLFCWCNHLYDNLLKFLSLLSCW